MIKIDDHTCKNRKFGKLNLGYFDSNHSHMIEYGSVQLWISKSISIIAIKQGIRPYES